MADFKLNRIRFTWKGPWTANTQYTKDDIVQYYGKVYVCLITHASNATNFYSDLNAQDGLGQDTPRWGVMMDGQFWKGNWDVDTFYSVNDLVKYRGIVYKCIVPHTSAATETLGLEQNIADWEVVARGQNWLNTWSAFTDYKKDDVVKYNGIVYLCTESHTSATFAGGLEVDTAKWVILSRSDSWQGDWATSIRYRKDDIVRFGANVYRCIVGHTSENTVEEGLYNELGTDSTIPKWELVYEGIQYLGYWAPATVYKPNDIVRYGPSLYKAIVGHNSSGRFIESEWELWLPGLGYEAAWNDQEIYQPGDIVSYGGYSYTALKINQNSLPAQVGKVQDGLNNDWELLTTGYQMTGEYDPPTLVGGEITGTSYKAGSVVRKNGYVYVCEADVIPQDDLEPGVSPVWRLIVTGIYYKKEWLVTERYYPGDVVIDKGTSYICKTEHDADRVNSRPSIDIDKGSENFWTTYIGGKETNVLRYRGDIRTYGRRAEGGFGTKNLAISKAGDILKVQSDSEIFWEALEETPKVYYVSLQGEDKLGNGFSPASPFRTVRYACQYVLADQVNRSPATIFVKTGIFEERLPISIPRDTAIVGDELRSTVIQPAAGFEKSDMFYMRNGSGLRNLTLQGLSGELGLPNENLTSRPDAGSYVSLDPGIGPDSEYAWITNKSPYVQNVSTFGNGCVGLKVDGTLHNGGNKSIVANDFTQILSDGIGYWVKGDGRSELVSVFTYYCHIGYLAEDGGKIRATNGNNSYGDFGSVAEGYDPTEQPIEATINNNTNQAQIFSTITNNNSIFGVFYTHCGQDYTTADLEISGSGLNADASYPEFRNEAISELRVTEESSNRVGGFNYQFYANKAQAGNKTQISLAGSDEGTNESYVGLRIYITSGLGIGQYAKIGSINEITKQVEVVKESNGEPGWEHVTGRPIAEFLNESTRYTIEPRPVIEEPRYQENVFSGGLPSAEGWSSLAHGNGYFVGVANGSANAIYSTNGDSWTPSTMPASAAWSKIAYEGSNFVVVASDGTTAKTSDIANSGWSSGGSLPGTGYSGVAGGNGTFIAVAGAADYGSLSPTDTFARSQDGGSSWSGVLAPSTEAWSTTAYSPVRDVWVALAYGSNNAAYSTDNGNTWIATTVGSATDNNWTDVIWGYDRFVAISRKEDSTPCEVAISFDGITWYDETMETGDFREIGYSQGLFVTFARGTDIVAMSEDGYTWRSKIVSDLGDWSACAGDDDNGIFVSLSTSETKSVKVQHGATAKVRAVVGTGRIGTFLIFNPGSGYKDVPTFFVDDPLATDDVTVTPRIFNGVLAQPAWANFGTNYTRSTAVVTGDGFASIYQTSTDLVLSNVTRVPGPGDNIRIGGIDDVTYFVTSITSVSGVGQELDVVVTISPNLGIQEAPEHNTSVIIRQNYSQVRLTGHDFLDIGTGNKDKTNYPNLYVEGYVAAQEPQPFNEVVQYDGGRVFYTSTDQDGNFRVGELFEVEQATGTISINAAYFDLGGLDELRLGGVVLGGTGAVIREFSTDGTFAADSNNIVPTQKAIATYIKGRVSSGGSDVKANRLNAGEISFFGNTILTPTNKRINALSPVKIGPYVQGSLVAMNYFAMGGMTPFSDNDK